MTCEILSQFIERVGLKEEAQIILPAIAARMCKIPFAETSEEVRLSLVELCKTMLENDKFQFLAQMGPMSSMLARALTDENPEMKQNCASFAAQLSRALPDKVGNYMKNVTDAMVQNLGHQHKNVRKITLIGLQDVLVARNAELYLQDCMKALRFIMNDRSADVRRTFYEVCEHWLTKMDINAIKVFEGDFVLCLLNGVADEQEDIGLLAKQLLDDHGKRMKDALQQLGELEPESKEDSLNADMID